MDVPGAVAQVPFWWHSIDLGAGIVTPGHKSAATLADEWAKLQIDDLEGRTVLDIGAWDGFFSFTAERLGAHRVVALDHFVWSLDLPRQQDYYRRCLANNETPQPYEEVPGLWEPERLPGKAGFDTARAALGSDVEAVVGDFMEVDPAKMGTFDVTLFLGVLYHMRHPLLALEQVRALTSGIALIETEAIVVSGHPGVAACEFYETGELAGDSSNWWAPTAEALLGMVRSAGFSRADLLTAAPPDKGEGILHFRAVVRAVA